MLLFCIPSIAFHFPIQASLQNPNCFEKQCEYDEILDLFDECEKKGNLEDRAEILNYLVRERALPKSFDILDDYGLDSQYGFFNPREKIEQSKEYILQKWEKAKIYVKRKKREFLKKPDKVQSEPEEEKEQEPSQNDPPFTFNQILTFIDQFDEDNLEEKHSPEELREMTHFLVNLAIQGTLPGESGEEPIIEDIQELMSERLLSFNSSFPLFKNEDLAFLSSEKEWILCSGSHKKNWNKVQKFFKKHKKAIIVGTVVIVAAAAVVYTIATSSATGGAAAASGAAAAGIASKGSKPHENVVATLDLTDETPQLQETLEEHITAFKELIVEENLFPETSLLEKARELGAFLAHEAVDGVSEIAYLFPKLNEEIKEIGKKALPSTNLSNEFQGDSLKNYEDSISKIHEKIDQAFAVDLREIYSPKPKPKDLVTGEIPPPCELLSPGRISQGIRINRFKEIVLTNEEAAIIAEELGFSSHEIIELEKAGSLQKTVVDTVDKIYRDNINTKQSTD